MWLLAFSCTSDPVEDEDEDGLHDLPPVSWKGQLIELGTDVEAESCPSTLSDMDEYMGGVDEHIRSNTSYPVRYHLLAELGPSDDAFELQEGLNLIRIIKPVAAEGRVRFSMEMTCF
jgi:hypothetical protein